MHSPKEKISSQNEDIFNSAPTQYHTSHRNIYLATFAVLLFIIAMGMVSSYSSPAGVDILRPGSRFKDLTKDEISWIASLPNLSGAIGNICSGYFSHKFGRKNMLMYISSIYTLSWLLIAYASSVSFIYVGRIFSGFSAGITTVAVPAYIVEISTVQIRGRLSVGFQLGFSVGVCIMTGLGIVLRWSWLAILGAVTVVTGACLLYFMPESPPWLIRKSKNEEAMRGIRFLKGKDHDAATEVKEIIEQIRQEPVDGLSFRELLNPSLYKPLIIAFGLMFNMSFCGFPAVMSYTVEVFKKAGSSINPNVAATIIAVVQMISTGISSILIDKAGRKPLYITSGSCMTVTLVILGIYTCFSQKHHETQMAHWSWVPLVSFIIYISTFSIGFGPIPFVVIPELVPTHSRSFVMAVGCFSASFLGFVVIKTFVVIQDAIGLYGLYFLYASITVLGTVFYWIFVPETKGQNIHDINKSFSKSPST